MGRTVSTADLFGNIESSAPATAPETPRKRVVSSADLFASQEIETPKAPVTPSAPKAPTFGQEMSQVGADLFGHVADFALDKAGFKKSYTQPSIGPDTGLNTPATPKQEKAMRFESELAYVKKHPGEQDAFEAFAGGIIPYNAKGGERFELMASAHPIAAALGTFTGFAATMLATAPLEGALRLMPIVKGLVKAGRPIETATAAGKLLAGGAKYMSRAIPRAMHFATAGFIKETFDSSLGGGLPTLLMIVILSSNFLRTKSWDDKLCSFINSITAAIFTRLPAVFNTVL
jgi:hypothetical protein